MKVTDVKPGRRGFSRVFLEGEYALSLDAEVLAEAGVAVGDNLEEEDLQELLERSKNRRATEKALTLLEYRSHSKRELQEKIARTAGREAARTAADRMEELGLIDDEGFARTYARELLERKRFASGRVLQELLRKGIDRETARQVLEELQEELQPDGAEETIREILERKYSGWREEEPVRRRAFAALQRMGYRYQEIRSAMEMEEE